MKRCHCLVYGLGVVNVHYTTNNTDSDIYLQKNNIFSTGGVIHLLKPTWTKVCTERFSTNQGSKWHHNGFAYGIFFYFSFLFKRACWIEFD